MARTFKIMSVTQDTVYVRVSIGGNTFGQVISGLSAGTQNELIAEIKASLKAIVDSPSRADLRSLSNRSGQDIDLDT